VLKIVRSAVESAGLGAGAVIDGLPRLQQAQHRAELAQHVSSQQASFTRDLALVLNLYWGAFRGSELVAMTWADAHEVEQGVEWRVRSSKSDQLGHGEVVGAARNPNPLLCPAASLLQWRHTLAGLLGRPPAEDEPVFVPLDGALHHLEALTRDGAAQAVKRAASAAGLVGNYASHSLRAGFVTDALDAGATREQVQRHGRTTARRRSGAPTTRRPAWQPVGSRGFHLGWKTSRRTPDCVPGCRPSPGIFAGGSYGNVRREFSETEGLSSGTHRGLKTWLPSLLA
jgi:hypothetical protein